MLHIILTLSVLINLSSGENCDKLGVLFYEDIGCKPIFKGSECPTNFECKVSTSDPDKCIFRGQTYNRNERVLDQSMDANCNGGCVCRPDYSRKFLCPISECPAWLGDPLSPGCYRNYTVGKCCSTGKICPPFDESIKCEVDGEVYQEGERFSPKDACYSCVCNKGFTGKYEEPFCRRKTCDIQLKHRVGNHCAPLYLSSQESLCCPSTLICPNNYDSYGTIQGEAKGELECLFGEKLLKLGQYVHVQRENIVKPVKCECVLPPFATCIAE